MARRRGFFNRNQPRDRKGRWTSGGASRGAARRAKRKTLTPAQQRVKRQKLNRFNRIVGGTYAGAGIGAFVGGAPGAIAGAVIGGTSAARRGRKRRK